MPRKFKKLKGFKYLTVKNMSLEPAPFVAIKHSLIKQAQEQKKKEIK